MSDPYLGQIMLTGFGFAPRGFAACNGTIMSIAQNQALFALLGVQYGGNGTTTFMLPDLRGRTPIGIDNAYPAGNLGGSESVTLLTGQLPPHFHLANASGSAGTTRNPTNALFGGSGSAALYGPSTGTQVVLNAASLDSAGQTGPHSNMQPYGVLNFCIALNGIYPSQN